MSRREARPAPARDAARDGFILGAIAGEMQAGVLALGAKGAVLYANPFFLKSFPVEGGVEGRTVREIIDDPALLKAVERLLRGRQGRAEEIELSERGALFKVRMVPLEMVGKGGRSLLLFLHDITEEKKVETIKKDFVANVSHELRTPLASIKGYAETLLDGAMEERETLMEFLRVIDRHATRMSRLIDDLLVLSRLESHELPMVMSQVDLKELVSGVVKGFEKQARDKKGIAIAVSIPEGLPKALGDRDRLEQVVVNLLDNAIKYTTSGGGVSVSASSEDDRVRVEVRDTGIGIPEGDLPRIFERFYRVDKARSRELGGTGLGLAIVKHIIQGHGGRLHVESAPGKGSAFSFVVGSAR
jgi:two-component system phosphate regulon sensor histidine kinase PhoR